ncbi:hypothetical protein Tco_1037786 [Tanacetum coccineum]
MDLCAKLSNRVLALENTNTSQAAEITTLKERVKKLEKKRRSRTYKPRRLYKVSLSRRIESSDDSLGAQEDASKQGRKIGDLDADIEVTLIDETQGRNKEDLMFDNGVLNGDEVFVSRIHVSAANFITTASVEIPKEFTLAQTLIEIKSAKPKAVTTVTPASSKPKAKGIAKDKGKEKMSKSYDEIQEMFDKEMKKINTFVDMDTKLVKGSKTKAEGSSKRVKEELKSDNLKKQRIDKHVEAKQLPQAKDKGKEKMVEPEKPLKKKDQILVDKEIA